MSEPTQMLSPEGSDLTFGRFVRGVTGSLFQVDSRLWRSIRALLLRPGTLSRSVLEHPDSLVHPVRIYLVVNLVFFFVVPFLNTDIGTIWNTSAATFETIGPYEGLIEQKLATSSLPESAARALYDVQVRSAQGAFVAVMIPLIGLPLFALLRGRRRFLAEHLLFATAACSVFLAALLAFGVPARLVQETSWSASGRTMITFILTTAAIVLSYFTWWLYRGNRTFYGLSRYMSVVFVVLEWVFLQAAFFAYMHVLFWATYFTADLG